MSLNDEYSVYILLCADNSLYCGITNDLEHRLSMHNAGKASKYTRARLPVKFVYIENGYDKSQALKREAEIKSLKRADKEELIKNVSTE